MSQNGPVRMRNALKSHWLIFLIEGILLVILGLGAIIVPPLASLAVTIFIGWLFLLSGVVGLALSFWMRAAPGFWWSLISALLGVAAGVVLIGWPVQGTITLTIVLGAYFIAEGVTTIMYALDHRRLPESRWRWLLAAGIIDILLAGILVAGLPGIAFWVLGLLVGINLVIGGASLIAMALALRSADPAKRPL